MASKREAAALRNNAILLAVVTGRVHAMTGIFTWLGHATVRLELSDGRVVFIDPWFENPSIPPAFRKPDRCDLVVVTHGHFDHTDGVGPLIERFNPPVLANYDLCLVLEKRIGKGRFEGMNTGGELEIDGVRVALTQAFHSSGVDSPSGPQYGGMPNGAVVAVKGLATVYHAGDTDVFSDMKIIAELHRPGVVCLPIGDRFTMGARGAAMAVEFLQPQAIVPIHYRTFPLLVQSAEPFRSALRKEMRSRLFAIDPGIPLTWTSEGLQSPENS